MTARISSPSLGAASYQEKGTWTAAVSHRWQYSDRHFIGDEEQEIRQKEGSEVINDVHLVDVSLSYAISKRVNAVLQIPFSFARRRGRIEDESQTNEFGNEKIIGYYWTEASGLGDIKLLTTAWVLDPDRAKKGNVSIGLGIKFPTGEKDHEDEFLDYDEATGELIAEKRPVDNSIQPGDGAWGIIVDLYGFREIVTNVTAFAAGTYIFTPEEDTGVNAGSGRIWSVSDSYLFRSGFGFTFWPEHGLTFTLGARMEGNPSTDIIGGSEGRRRPGFAISVEPGLVMVKNRWFASFSAPFAVYRNRERNFEGDAGDAAFADFMTLATIGRVF